MLGLAGALPAGVGVRFLQLRVRWSGVRDWAPVLTDARHTVEGWRRDDNRARPHSALGYRASEEFRLGFDRATITRRELVGLS